MSDTGQWRWTAKGPALLAGLLLIAGGFLFTRGRWRYSLPIGVVLMVGGGLLVAYSTTVQTWCAPAGGKFGGMEWGVGFYTKPTVHHCIRLVYPGWR